MVRFLGAKIGGQMSCTNATFTNPRAAEDLECFAFNGDGLETGRGLTFANAKSSGMVRILGAKIGGQIDCTSAIFTNPRAGEDPQAYAFDADGIEVTGNLYFDGAESTGMVRLLGAKIGDQLNCVRATFTNPRARADTEALALSAHGIEVASDFLIVDANVSGGIRLSGTTLKSGITFDGGIFAHENAFAIDLQSARIDDTLRLRRIKRITGAVDLTSARCRVLDDDDSWWTPNRLRLDGFEYGSISKLRGVKDRLRWLACDASSDFCPRPYYEQLITGLGWCSSPPSS